MIKDLLDVSKADVQTYGEDLLRLTPENKDKIPYLVMPLGSTAFESCLLLPDEPRYDDEVVVFQYGLGSNGVHHYREATAMAELGYQVAIHDTPRLQLAIRGLLKHMKNPLIYPSEISSELMDAVEDRTDINKFCVKCHSMGGVSGTMLACHDHRIQQAVLDAPAGIYEPFHRTDTNPHDENVKLGGIYNVEIKPFVDFILKNYSGSSKFKAFKHIFGDPTRVIRETLFLTVKDPDITAGLEEMDARGVDTAVITHELDEFFPFNDTNRAVEALVARGLVHYHRRVMGTLHVNPNLNPEYSAELFNESVLALKSREKRTPSGLIVPADQEPSLV